MFSYLPSIVLYGEELEQNECLCLRNLVKEKFPMLLEAPPSCNKV